MPTYTVNMGGDPSAKAWADGASALAELFTPDYKEMADGKVRAAQAYNSYASADANQALARERTAKAVASERVNQVWAEFDAQVASGELSAEEAEQLKSETLFAAGLVDGGNFGDYNLANTALDPNITDERVTDYQIGSGMSFDNTIQGTREGYQNELDQIYAKPMETDFGVVFGPGDPRAQQYPGGVMPGGELSAGSTMVSPDFDPDGNYAGTSTYTAPGATPKRTFSTFKDGATQYTYFIDPAHPDADEYGRVITNQTPIRAQDGSTAGLSGDIEARDNEYVVGLLDAGTSSTGRIQRYDMLMALNNELEKLGYKTGPITEKLMKQLLPTLAQFGLVDEQAVAMLEQFAVETGDEVMSRIQDTKGAISDREMAYFAKISPGVSRTPLGNRAILLAKRNIAARDARMATLIRQWAAENKTASEIQQLLALEFTKPENQIITPEMSQMLGMEPFDFSQPGVVGPHTPVPGVTPAGGGGSDPLVDRWIGGGD